MSLSVCFFFNSFSFTVLQIPSTLCLGGGLTASHGRFHSPIGHCVEGQDGTTALLATVRMCRFSHSSCCGAGCVPYACSLHHGFYPGAVCHCMVLSVSRNILDIFGNSTAWSYIATIFTYASWFDLCWTGCHTFLLCFGVSCWLLWGAG